MPQQPDVFVIRALFLGHEELLRPCSYPLQQNRIISTQHTKYFLAPAPGYALAASPPYSSRPSPVSPSWLLWAFSWPVSVPTRHQIALGSLFGSPRPHQRRTETAYDYLLEASFLLSLHSCSHVSSRRKSPRVLSVPVETVHCGIISQSAPRPNIRKRHSPEVP